MMRDNQIWLVTHESEIVSMSGFQIENVIKQCFNPNYVNPKKKLVAKKNN